LLKLDCKYLEKYIKNHEYYAIEPQIEKAHNFLHSRKNLRKENVGWVDLPINYDKKEFLRIKKVAEKIKSDSDVLIVIGIGGSYIGSRAAIEFLKSEIYNNLSKDTPDVYFAGKSISASSLDALLKICKNKRVSLNVISKSGTTIEPAIAFTVFKNFMEKNYGKIEASKRIYCTTDKENGDLKKMADSNFYETFVIPKNIGGRFSVLTAVGLLPMAVCGAKIEKVLEGAKFANRNLKKKNLEENDCYKYAAIRNILYRKAKYIEIAAFFEPRFSSLGKWFEQLFGESEGKDSKGIFPSSMIFSTDLHSMGQFIQDGSKNIFETVLYIDEVGNDFMFSEDLAVPNNISFLVNKKISWVNEKAFEGTSMAHSEGGIPVAILHSSVANEQTLGYIFYFLEKACAISSFVMGVNPFDQPGVESYKKHMFALLGKHSPTR
jgi:glucose-6-phosphate isomerase